MKRELKKTLWEAYVKKADIPRQQKSKIQQLGEYFFEDVSFLYQIYGLIGEENVCCKNGETGIIFEKEDDLYILRKESMGIFLRAEEMKCLLRDMIVLLEDILPLGSVVDLRKDKLHGDVSKVEHFRVVITKRFLGVGEGCFYPYGAVVYPLGTGGTGKNISFTPALIERVIYEGYSDELEDVFLYQMKNKLIVEQKRMSVGFATKKELAELTDRVCKLEV